MSTGGRKRNSKWDLQEQANQSLEDIPNDDWHGKSDMRYHVKESEPAWFSSEANARTDHRRSGMESNDKMKSKHDLRLVSREPFPKSKGTRKNDDNVEDYTRSLKSMSESESYGSRMSPEIDDRKQITNHHSPKDDWHRSHRSRSRSRSPGIRRQSGFNDRNRSRSGLSTTICKDFASGRCRRGSSCTFLHQGDPSYDDSWESRNRKDRDSRYSSQNDSREYPMRPSSRYVHDDFSDGTAIRSVNEVIRDRGSERRDRGGSLEQLNGRESRRGIDIPCKFFAAGNCRNGKHCRFSHHGEERLSPERRLRDDRKGWDQNSNDVEKSWNGPKWSDVNDLESAKLSEERKGRMENSEPRFSSWSGDDSFRQSFNEKDPNGGSAVDNKVIGKNKKETSQWKTESACASAGISEAKSNEKWLNDMEMSPEWNYGVKPSSNCVKEELGNISCSSQSLSLNNASITNVEPDLTKDASSWTHDAVATLQPTIPETSYDQHDLKLRQTDAATLPCINNNVADKSLSTTIDLNYSKIVPAQNFDKNCQISSSLPYSSFQAFEQNRLATPTDHATGLTLKGPVNDALFREKSLVNKLDTRNSVTAQVSSANVVSSEQLTQLTNISASLAHLLGKGQQLPQLYAALNPQNAMHVPSSTNVEGPVGSDGSMSIHSNLSIASQKQYDPVCDSIDPKDRNNNSNPQVFPINPSGQQSNSNPQVFSINPSGQQSNSNPQVFPINPSGQQSNSNPQVFPINPSGQQNIAVGKVELPPSNLTSITSMQPDTNTYQKASTTEEEPIHANHFLKQQEPEKDSKERTEIRAEDSGRVQEDKMIAQESGDLHPPDIEGDGKTEDSKKNKDLKAIRAFKFSLVELVKELLKPTWKEGQMSKEAYKNIVKKVVDKVTNTMQGANIPQTQEKIDQYLSFSKPKVTKLIQAYVEKFQKT